MELKGGPGMQKLKALANAAGVTTTTAEGVKPGSRTPNRGKSIDELRDELIEKLGIPEKREMESLNRALFDTLQRLEDKRSEVEDLNIKKKNKAKEARKQAKMNKESYVNSSLLNYIREYRESLTR